MLGKPFESKSGKVAHSRWLTTANRILGLYVATPDPTHELQIMTEYIVKVYAPVWFAIKSHSSFTDSANTCTLPFDYLFSTGRSKGSDRSSAAAQKLSLLMRRTYYLP